MKSMNCFALFCLATTALIGTGHGGLASQQFPPGHVLVDDMVLPRNFFEQDGLYNRRLWTTGIIPYEFDPAVGPADRVRMRDAMDTLDAVCGIRFVPRWSTATDWVLIVVSIQNDGSSWSELGRRGGRQKIGQYPGFSRLGNLHELMHTMGYLHEHQRPDRDNYVTINTGNITTGRANQFYIVNQTIVGAYDYDSVMHYRAYAFSNGNGPTITSPTSIGNRDHIGNLTAAMLRTHYGVPPKPGLTRSDPFALAANPPGPQTVILRGSRLYKPYPGVRNTNRGTEVFFNNVQLTNVTVNSNNTVTAEIPAYLLATTGRYPITVANPQPGIYPTQVSAPLWINVPSPPSNRAWWGSNYGFGDEIEITGDVNNGGHREVLVSNVGNGGSLFGKVFVMSPETGRPVATIPDPNSYVAGYFGRALADLGNVDGDLNGISDFAVGNPGHPVYNSNPTRQGRVIVYAGNNLTTPLYTILPPTGYGAIFQFGRALARIDDVDNDGVADLAIGAPGWSGNSNAVFIHSGRTGSHLYRIQESAIDGLGETLAYMGGNLLAIGAPSYSTTNRFRVGYAAVYRLGATSGTRQWGSAYGFAGAWFGSDLAAAGDVDGDGVMDVAITSPGARTGNNLTPSVMVFSGNSQRAGLPLTFYNLNRANAPWRMRVTSVGDTDGDGQIDLAVGDDTDVYVVSAVTPQMTLIKRLTGAYGGDLAGGKDIFSIGTQDLVTGAPNAALGTTKKGLVEIQPLAASAFYGQGCSATTQPPPQLVSTSRPVIGQNFSFVVRNSYTAAGNYTLFLVLDIAPPANVPLLGCISYVRLGQTAVIAAVVPLAAGVENQFSFQIPSTGIPPFQGFVMQGFVIDPFFYLNTTNAQALRIGTR